jgi:hypothetical protein
MAKFVEMDEQVTLSKQMEDDVGGSVILLNKFTVNAEDVDQFLKPGPMMLRSLSSSLDSSQPNCIGVLHIHWPTY